MNPMAYVIEGMTPVAVDNTYMVNLKIKNHGCMTALTTGVATRDDIEVLIMMANMCEAMYRMGFGIEYADVVKDGLDALLEVARRGAPTKHFVLKSAEMLAVNSLLELHDAQLDVVTIRDMEKAITLVAEEIRNKRTRKVVEKTK